MYVRIETLYGVTIFRQCYQGECPPGENIINMDEYVSEEGLDLAMDSTSQDTKDMACMYLEQNRICDILGNELKKVHLLGYLVSCPLVKGRYRMELFDKLDEIYDNNEDEFLVQKEVFDVMIQQFPARAQRMRERIDQITAQITVQPPQYVPKPNLPRKVISDDSQNVHNSTINSSAITAMKTLIDLMVPVSVVNDFVTVFTADFKSPAEFHDHLQGFSVNKLEFSPADTISAKTIAIDSVSKRNSDTIRGLTRTDKDRIVKDLLTAHFSDVLHPTHSSVWSRISSAFVRDVPLFNLFLSVIKFAKTNPDIIRRLDEELMDGMTECTTGLATRMINSIQGFFSDVDFPCMVIRISDFQQLQMRVVQMAENICTQKDVDVYYDRAEFMKELELYIEEHLYEILEGHPLAETREADKQFLLNFIKKVFP